MYMIRGSELTDFLRCRLRWRWAWIDGLKAKKSNNKLVFGTAFHKFLEDFYNNEIQWGLEEHIDGFLDIQADDMDDVEYQEMIDTLTKVATNYWGTYRDTDLNNWETVATELTFAIPLDDEIGYTGTIDLIVRDKRNGKLYFLDHKTTSSIDKYDKNSDMDRQISRYWWALQQLKQGNGIVIDADESQYREIRDTKIGGFIYNIILRDYPVAPKVLKDGSLSKDKSQKTTYEMYLSAIREHCIDIPPKYDEILSHLKRNPKEFFRRIPVIRNQQEINAAIEEMYATSEDMYKISHDSTISTIQRKTYRNITTDCSWDCSFYDICRASLDGSNVDFLIDELYTKEEVK